MKNFLFTLLVLVLVIYWHRQQDKQNFAVWVAVNSLKYKGKEWASQPMAA